MTPTTSSSAAESTGGREKAPFILVIEDEKKTRESLAEGFSLEGWGVCAVRSAEEASAEVDAAEPDVIVLDWMLPGRDGPDFLRALRARGVETPVLMLTARDAVADRVAGLETGADDYLAKPFAFAELVARCRALLRRPLLSVDRLLQCDDLQVDTRARVARRAGVEIALTPREVDVLEYMMRRPGQIVTREMLEREVWKQTHRFTSLDNVIDVQVMRLRRKIDREGATKLLHTVRGVGYRLGRDVP